MTEIVQIARDPARKDGGVLCQLDDGRVFVTLSDEIRKFALEGDESALPAFNRAWSHKPDLFAGPIRPRVPVIETSDAPGLAADLTEEDRQRLYKIIDKHWRFYFAEPPTLRQKDNLIDGIGARVAERLVKREVDAGRL